MLSQQRRQKRKNRVRNENCEFTAVNIADVDLDGDSDIKNNQLFVDNDAENLYIANEIDEPKSKYEYALDHSEDDLPYKYRHVRSSVKCVKDEIYIVYEKLAAVYHMSHRQIQGAITTVANELFGRKKFGEWKMFSEQSDASIIDNNTLPFPSNARRTEKYMEAMALAMIVNDIMQEDSESCVVYSNDGSAQSGLGSFIVQSLTINGVQRSLPTFGIFTESRESLKELELTTLEILSACSGYAYSKSDIMKKISFVMTDSTEHNIGVIEKLCEELNIDASEIPSTLLCNIHPLMMFQDKIKKLCQIIHSTLGDQKISDCFLVDIEFHNESFVIKAIKCLTNFINKDYSAKSWNRSNHFDQFIKPKKNMSITLKDHRFNRLSDCTLTLLYHLDDIAKYLDKFSHIVNGITIIDRSFVEMEILKPIFAAISLLGIHFTRPFHSLLLDKDTNYTILTESYKLLYDNLTNIDVSHLLTTKKVCNFVVDKVFDDSLPDKCLIDILQQHIQQYPVEITKIVSMALKMFAEGLSIQKGAIFGFGPKAEDDTGKKLKICKVKDDVLQKLDDHVQTSNIGEERNVEIFTYEVAIRGKKNLESASRKVLLNRSKDLLEEKPNEYRKFRKEANIVKEIRNEWDKKMDQLQEESYLLKEVETDRKSAMILEDTEFLKGQVISGPFTSVEEIDLFMNSCPESKEKNKRMYREVRFHRMTSNRKKETDSIFRLKKDGKNLETIDYANNLKSYLNKTKRLKSISIAELNTVLMGLQAAVTPAISKVQKSNETLKNPNVDFEVGEHVATFWLDDDDDTYKWNLGVITELCVENSPDDHYVSYFIRANKSGTNWTYPEEAEMRKTNTEQIIGRNLTVTYHCHSMIRCSIPQWLAKKIDTDFGNAMKKL